MGTVHRTAITAITAVVSMTLSCGAFAESGAIRLFLAETNLMAQVRGDPDDDWHIQSSPDLVNWVTLTNVHTLLSGGPKAPIRLVGTTSQLMTFYRALKTGGLFDPALLRTFSMRFTQANWQTQLANGRTKGTNAYCSLLTLDNGATNVGIGARYRGNTSYTGMGGSAPVKKSINIETDFTVPRPGPHVL